ncbi:MAG TPA: hypothetical protein DEB06_04640 [Phycisphaerales bacterium]|nr:hypothetical protein [Phycisphaerales bacterium]
MLTRAAVVESLSRLLRANEVFRAAWLGGSDANGRADEMSDVDIFFVHTPGRADEAERAFDGAVESIGEVAIRYRVPEPAWHGGRQVFYQLKDAPEWLMIDWLALEQGKDHQWLDVERHGTPTVLFDKDGLVRTKRVDRAAIEAAVRKKVEDVRQRFPLLRHLAAKQSTRGLPIDGAYSFQALVLRPLVDLLRCVHCPDRHDFGFRYLKDDLPGPVYEQVCALAYPRGPEDLERLTREATAMFGEAMEVWGKGAGESWGRARITESAPDEKTKGA